MLIYIAYHYKCRKKGRYTRTEANDSLSDIFKNPYVKAEVSEDGVVKYLDLEPYRAQYDQSPITISEFINALTDYERFLSLKLYTQIDRVEYEELYSCGYTVFLGKEGEYVPEGYPLTAMDDLIIKRPNSSFDKQAFFEACVVTVNGFLYPIKYTNDELYVSKAGRSRHITPVTKQNTIGIINFQNIGVIRTIPLEDVTVNPYIDNIDLFKGLVINYPRKEGKSYLVSIGGYLHHFPTDYLLLNDKLTIFLDKTPYMERLLDTIRMLDVSQLELPKSDDATLDKSFVTSDSFIRRYLNMPQSFIIEIDTPFIETEVQSIKNGRIPNRFRWYDEPRDLLITNYGNVSNYDKTYYGDWLVKVLDPLSYRYRHNERMPERYGNSARIPGVYTPSTFSHFLSILKYS